MIHPDNSTRADDDPILPKGDGVFFPAFIPSTKAERIAEARALARSSFRKPLRPRRAAEQPDACHRRATADDELARWRRKHAR